ncbi:MAG: polyprenyl synthetase family protein [Bacteroidales bacterium]|nr:polyprenyl synthetase family protein [Bacteroidales bacterium]
MSAKIIQYLGQDWIDYKEVFVEKLSSQIPLLEDINSYMFGHMGKQLRPMLALLSSRVCAGSCSRNSILCAAASEMLHTATLLHDDVADGSRLRRGNPTVMALYSPAASVLVGDYWLSRAIRTIIDDCGTPTISAFATCLQELAQGEMFQMQKAASGDTTESDYLTIISYKTASLFRTAMKSGAYSVNASEKEVEAVDKYAYHLGLAFQIRDDILDYSPELKTGKPAGQDIKEHKITLPLLGAMANATESECKRVLRKVAKGRKRYVIGFVNAHAGMDYAQKRLEEESRKAIAALDIFPDSEAKGLLRELAANLCSRTA